MARDDYFVLVYKILSYFYAVLKEGRPPEGEAAPARQSASGRQ